MTTQTRRFWETPEFAEFLPYIKATAAGDKRHFAHPRFDLKASTPYPLVAKAMDYRAPCANCGKPIKPFRQREGDRSVYLGVSCEQYLSSRCSRGNKASAAYDAIWALVRQNDPPQGSLL